MAESFSDLENKIHWSTSEEMLITAEHKYDLILPEAFPFQIQFYQFTEAHPVIPNYHDFYEISYFYSGRGMYHVADKDIPVQPGDIVLIQAGLMHQAEADPSDPLKTASLYFMPDLVIPTGAQSFEFQYLLPFHRTTETCHAIQEQQLVNSVWEMFLSMHHTLHTKPDYFELTLKSTLCQFLISILKLNLQSEPAVPQNSTPIKKIKRLDAVFHTIHHQFSQSIQLDDLADIACMSASYFCRYFKQVTGLTPVQYISRYRIDKSKELLIHSDLSITQIAFQVGFNSQSYFDRIFRKLTTLSPNQFRQAYQIKNDKSLKS